jgi:hypothetical protein
MFFRVLNRRRRTSKKTSNEPLGPNRQQQQQQLYGDDLPSDRFAIVYTGSQSQRGKFGEP